MFSEWQQVSSLKATFNYAIQHPILDGSISSQSTPAQAAKQMGVESSRIANLGLPSESLDRLCSFLAQGIFCFGGKESWAQAFFGYGSLERGALPFASVATAFAWDDFIGWAFGEWVRFGTVCCRS